MISYLNMVNAWSLAHDVLNGTLDENFPIMTGNIEINTGLGNTADTITINGGDSGDSYADAVDYMVSEMPGSFTTFSDNDDAIAHHVTTPTPGIEVDCPRKYKEDESIKALQDYISTTYNGHYTSKENNVQTLDLIESVGDAEAFCRSNAIKYLSRYDKKGQAKRDILKALHYSLLLYHFSGQLNETPTRGYETF